MKYFKYTFSISRHKYHGNWKNNLIYKDFETFKTFKNFIYKGLEIIDTTTYTISFKVDKQLIRKIKILNLGDKIEKTEKLILYFIENSIEKTEDDILPNTWYNYSNSWNVSIRGESCPERRIIDDYEIQERKDRKKNLKYQSKNVSLRAKQYMNKVKIRK